MSYLVSLGATRYGSVVGSAPVAPAPVSAPAPATDHRSEEKSPEQVEYMARRAQERVEDQAAAAARIDAFKQAVTAPAAAPLSPGARGGSALFGNRTLLLLGGAVGLGALFFYMRRKP